MVNYDWAEIRTDTTERFGESPGNLLEQQIINQFEQHPKHVLELIERIATRRAAGSPIRSPWAILLHELQNAPIPIAPNVEAERHTRILNAEAWTRNAGHYLPEPELLRHLFATAELTPTLEQLLQIELDTRDRPGRKYYDTLLATSIRETRANGPQEIPDTAGVLHDLDTPALRKRMLDLYRENRPRGQHAEADCERRALERVELRAKLAEARRNARPQLEPEYDDDPNWHHTPEPEHSEA